ncbi:Uncharacterized protein FWK35_00008945 [Aphis craccivora]|uniref:Uncharacterized protein n=1 Tax=Aphis craccivora TaxID=307492 RepID=A0A6G0YTK8_APHCR|nr:Uncharacterized protein FWK35_00008945 [Aphis craccivora]
MVNIHPKKKSVKVRRMGETSYKHTQPESSIERTDNEYLETQSARSAFNYDPNIDYVRQRAITIESMSKTCSKCFAKKWSYESNGMCCAGGKVILLDIEEPPQPLNSLLTNIYFISDADQLSLRSNMGLSLKTDLINELQTILNSHNAHNEHVRSFKYNLETNSFKDNLKLIIRTDRTPQNQH